MDFTKNTLQQINNEAINNPGGLVRSAEDFYLSEIDNIAKVIADDDDIKIVSIAGPSASGKTTTAHILCDKLSELGENTIVVSLDDFYLPTDRLPILPNGKKDIESVNSLDIDLIEKFSNEIIKNGKSMQPKYDFTTKTRTLNAREVDISEQGIIIFEGLHALNPLITDLVPKNNIYKVYISVNSSIYEANGRQLLTSRQIRLMRRSLRDEIFRNSSFADTLSLWSGVVEGETKYLYCFKDTADYQLKTLHIYEPCLYKNRFLSYVGQISEDDEWYDYFTKTAEAVEKFVTLDSKYIPHDSLIREFIGEGKYN